ncbi:MAG: hypothetical protein IIA14_07935, partial [SAR324 cluster bacterium]|nr:hypothetical protein [SAR324 cluster bacterium]
MAEGDQNVTGQISRSAGSEATSVAGAVTSMRVDEMISNLAIGIAHGQMELDQTCMEIAQFMADAQVAFGKKPSWWQKNGKGTAAAKKKAKAPKDPAKRKADPKTAQDDAAGKRDLPRHDQAQADPPAFKLGVGQWIRAYLQNHPDKLAEFERLKREIIASRNPRKARQQADQLKRLVLEIPAFQRSVQAKRLVAEWMREKIGREIKDRLVRAVVL